MRLVSLLLGGLFCDFAGTRAACYTGGALLAVAALAGFTVAGSSRNPGHDQDWARKAWRAWHKPPAHRPGRAWPAAPLRRVAVSVASGITCGPVRRRSRKLRPGRVPARGGVRRRLRRIRR